jgi:hypothetical protein
VRAVNKHGQMNTHETVHSSGLLKYQLCSARYNHLVKDYYEGGKRRWVGVGIQAACQARSQKEQEMLLPSRESEAQPKPSSATPKSLDELRTAFIRDKNTTFKKDGSPLDPATIRSYENVAREFLDIVKRTKHGRGGGERNTVGAGERDRELALLSDDWWKRMGQS